MIGMVYKDFMVLRKQCFYYLFFILLYTVLTVSGAFGTEILSAIIVVFAMMMPISSFAYDDAAHWDKFASATPAGRSGVVTGKYLFTLFIVLLSALLVSVLLVILFLLRLVEGSLAELLFPVVGCLLIALLMDGLILPFLIKFGAEKSRIISLILFATIFGGTMLLAPAASIITPFLGYIPSWVFRVLPGVAALLCIFAFAASYSISKKLYQKKDM